MKKIVLCFLVLIVATTAFCQHKVALATPLTKGENIDEFYSEVLLSAFEKEASSCDKWKIVARGSVVDALLADFDFEASGVMTDSYKAQLAYLPNVDYLCVSSISSSGRRFLINAKLVDKKTGEYIKIVSRVFQTRKDYAEVCSEVATELFESVRDADDTMSIISDMKKR